MKLFLAIALSTLMPSVPAFADTIPAGAKIFGSQPVGTGEPAAISCYRAAVTGTHMTRMLCHPNSEWARASTALAPIDGSGGLGLGPYAGDGMPSGNLSQPH